LRPKQVLPLVSERSMLQETALRVSGDGFAAPFVVCNEEHRFLVAEQLRVIGHSAQAILLEPAGRNTAPAIAIAALQATRDGWSDPLLLSCRGHVIHNVAAFHAAVAVAQRADETAHSSPSAWCPTSGNRLRLYPSRCPHRGQCAVHRIAAFSKARCRARWFLASGDTLEQRHVLFRASRPPRLGKHARYLAACRKSVDGAERTWISLAWTRPRSSIAA
jgi:hypothetical protein